MDFKLLGKLLLFAGLILALLGLLFISSSKISWLGKLPGDIIISRKNFHFYFPITTCILISIIISIIIWLFSKR